MTKILILFLVSLFCLGASQTNRKTGMNEELAKRLFAASASCQQNISFNTAYRMYCQDPERPIGGVWLEMAATAHNAMNESAGVAVFVKEHKRDAIW